MIDVRNDKLQDVRNEKNTDVRYDITYFYYITLELFSLSRREESRKHKLFACLLVCPHFTDWSKKNVKINGAILYKT